MIEYILGNFLVKKEKLTDAQLQKAIYTQHKVRVKLGLIAMAEGLMTKEQTEDVHRIQAIMDKRFGDIAVERGYLTPPQVDRLLVLQGNAYLSFAQTLVNEGFLTFDDIKETMELMQKEYGFTNSDMEIMKSDNVDKIVPLFLPSGDAVYGELVGVAVRLIIRLIDSHVYIGKAFFADAYTADMLISQRIEGDKKIITSIAADGEGLLLMACPFAEEVFYVVDEEVVDAVGEFLNTVNGMYVTAASHNELMLELVPPEYELQETVLEEKALIVPCYFGNDKVDLIVRA